jgi:hypothetical protein
MRKGHQSTDVMFWQQHISKSKEKECEKGIIEPMSHFSKNAFLESNKEVSCVARIDIQ